MAYRDLLRTRVLRYTAIAVLAFSVGSASVVLAASSGAVQLPTFRIADGTNPEQFAKVDAAGNVQVSVNNFPATQPVSGSVSVTNLPATQLVTGTVNVANLPATQPVSGTVAVSNFPSQQQLVATHVESVVVFAAAGQTDSVSLPARNVSFVNVVMQNPGCTFRLFTPAGPPSMLFDPRGADLQVAFPVRLTVNKVSWENHNLIGNCDMFIYLVSD
jgi:hypothetical protein